MSWHCWAAARPCLCLPPRAAAGPGRGVPHPLAGAEEAPRLAFIPALSGKAPEPALRLGAQESTAKLSVGSPEVIPGGRLVSNTLCPCEILIHVAPVRAADSNHRLEGHTGVKPHRKPSECKASVISVIRLKQIIGSRNTSVPQNLLATPTVEPDGSIPNCFVTGHLSKGSGGESGSKAQGWKMEMTVRKGMWSFTTAQSWRGREEQGEGGRRKSRR